MKKGSQYGLVDFKGQVLLVPNYELLLPECVVYPNKPISIHEPWQWSQTNNRYYFFEKDGKMGVMDSAFNIIVSNKHLDIQKNYWKDYLNIRTATGWGLYSFSKKKFTIPPIYEKPISGDSSSFLFVHKNKQLGIVNGEHQTLLPTAYPSNPQMNEVMYKGILALGYGSFNAIKRQHQTIIYVDAYGQSIKIDL